MCSFLPFEVHIDDVVVLIQHHNHFISRFERLLPVTPSHVRIELVCRACRCRHHERACAAGFLPNCYEAGVFYTSGRFVPRDVPKGVQLLQPGHLRGLGQELGRVRPG